MNIKTWLLSGLVFFCSLLIYTAYTNYTLDSGQVQLILRLTKGDQIKEIFWYYETDEGFLESQKVELTPSKNGQYSGFIELKEGIQGFRLDFPKKITLAISELTLKFGSKKWSYKPNEIRYLVKNYSKGIQQLSFNEQSVLVKTGEGDPYISFKTVGPNEKTFFFWILALLCFIYPAINFFKKEFHYPLDLFCLPLILFITSIPLKESLSTFSVLCFFLFVLFRIYKRKGKIFWSPIMWLGLLLLVPIPYIFFNSMNTNAGIYLGATFFLFSIPQMKFEDRQINKIRRFYFLFSFLFSMLFLGLIFHILATNGLSLAEYFKNPKAIGPYIAPFFPYYHPTFLSYFFGLSLFIGLKPKLFNVISKLIIIAFLIMSTSRFAIYMILLWGCLLLMKRGNVPKYFYYMVSMISFIGTYIVAYLFDPIRREQWDFYLQRAINFFGNGLHPSTTMPFGTSYTHAHNQYIWYISVYGIIPFLMLLAYSIFLWSRYMQSKNIIKTFVVSCFIALCIIESPFNTNKASLMMTFVMGFFLIGNSAIIHLRLRKT